MHADSTTGLIRMLVNTVRVTQPAGRIGGVWTLKKMSPPSAIHSIPLDTWRLWDLAVRGGRTLWTPEFNTIRCGEECVSGRPYKSRSRSRAHQPVYLSAKKRLYFLAKRRDYIYTPLVGKPNETQYGHIACLPIFLTNIEAVQLRKDSDGRHVEAQKQTR